MHNQPTLLSKFVALFVGPSVTADSPPTEMTREQLARMKAEIVDKVDEGYELGFPSDRFTMSGGDLLALIRLAEKSFELEDERKRYLP